MCPLVNEHKLPFLLYSDVLLLNFKVVDIYSLEIGYLRSTV
jgi:hypothetical protein